MTLIAGSFIARHGSIVFQADWNLTDAPGATLSINIHNPDQYMAALRTIIAQGRKRVGLLVGAGAPAGMAKEDGSRPLIPAVIGLTNQVLKTLDSAYRDQIEALKGELVKQDIETILSRVRSLSKVIGKSQIHKLDGDGYDKFGKSICTEIGKIVDVRLPKKASAYSEIVNWISRAILTTLSEFESRMSA